MEVRTQHSISTNSLGTGRREDNEFWVQGGRGGRRLNYTIWLESQKSWLWTARAWRQGRKRKNISPPKSDQLVLISKKTTQEMQKTTVGKNKQTVSAIPRSQGRRRMWG